MDEDATMRESRSIEFKEQVSNTFLKSVSAFANYGGGEIIFGITDDGVIKGLQDPKHACQDIETKINDSLDPLPEYTLNINESTSVVTLKIMEGLYKPYLYKSMAYRRNDSASIPVDKLELERLILEGQNLSFEELPSHSTDLSFNLLEEKLKKILQINKLNLDTLKTLELYSIDQGYNRAADLLADKNSYPGLDMARFGDSISIILDRETYDHISILKLYDQALLMYRKYYQYEEIKGSLRETVSLIPEKAFREAIANAIVHRTWDVNAHINVSMFPDRIEVTSPGGLTKGMDKDTFLRGGISMLRNRIIGSVFFRLHFIEKFGSGVKRINEEYRQSAIKPSFGITENSIAITLPVVTESNNMSPDENKVYQLLKGREMSSSAISSAAGFGKNKSVCILKALVDKGYAKVSGNGRGTRYYI